MLAASAVLALGAAAAAYAAFHKRSHRPPTVTRQVAQAPAPAQTVPVTPPPTTLTPTPKAVPPVASVKPPKIPLTVPTPPSSGSTGTGTSTTNPSSTTTTNQTGGSGGSEENQPAAILLDTNAASTYNPYHYADSDFGDPSLTIDGDSSTGWSARVEATTAPNMAEGVLLDLKARDKVSSLELITSTPGIAVQVYGAKTPTAPTSITDPAWVALSHQKVVRKRRTRIQLRHPKQAFTFITLWISKAPASSTPAAPGHVSVNELELFPTAG
jgi:hypothetical protein